MWRKKLIKKKFQFILVALMLCFTSAIFAASISFVAETKNYTETYTSVDGCPRVVSIADRKYDEEYFKKSDDLMKETSDIRFSDLTLFYENLYLKEKKIENYRNVAYYVDDINSFMHSLKMIEGDETAPKYKEIWICTVCADSYGISLGDILTRGSPDGEAFTVSGIVATPICPSPYVGTLPFYISEDTAELLDGTQMQGASFYSDTLESSDEYKKLLPKDFQLDAVSFIDSATIKLSISELADIFGGVGLIAATVIFAVSLVIIRFIIVSALAKEYKEIGTYKALGFTVKQILGIYLKCFVLSGVTGIILGTVASFPITKYLCNMVVRHLGSFSLTKLSLALAAGTVVFLSAALVLGVLFSLRKIHKITPVEAFSSESTSSKKKTGGSLIKNAYSPLSVAVNDIAKRKGASAMMALVLTISFYMSILFSSVHYSVSKIGDMQDYWFAFPKYDAIVSLFTEDDVKKYLDESELVERYLLSETSVAMQGIRSELDVDMNNVFARVFDNLSEEYVGLPLVEGRHPQSDDEILLSYSLADQTGVKTGDWVHFENDDYSNDYLVTGLFSSMFDGGLNIVINGDEFAQFGLFESYSEAMITLRDGVTYEEFQKDAKEHLPNANISDVPPFLKGSINSINSISKPLTSMFVFIFALFSVLNVVNLLIMNNIDNRRQYGILKAMGFTNTYICFKNILRIMILTTFASAAAVLLSSFLSQKIFFTVINVNGVVENYPLTLTVTGILYTVIFIVAMLFTLPMRKVTPTELMEE